MTQTTGSGSRRRRVEAILRGQTPDRLPFVERLEIWYDAHQHSGTMPPAYASMSLLDIHRAVGMGQMSFLYPYSLRLRGVDLVVHFNGEVIHRERDPELDCFPRLFDYVARDRPGITLTELHTPAGVLSVEHQMLPAMIAAGTAAYPRTHLMKGLADYPAVEYILERAEYVPKYERIYRAQIQIGEDGYVIPLLQRMPFQQVLLDYLGEIDTFYALHDAPDQVERLLQLVDDQMSHILQQLAALDVLYVEFPDNMDGMMTNPRLFERYCLPTYQRFAEILHGQGKRMGSHTDGNLRSLLALLRESGLDVCESVSPTPQTETPFEEIWDAWQGGPIIWGGIPSAILEEGQTTHADFVAWIDRLFQLIGSRPIILGVGDMVMGNDSIERVRYIAERVEAHVV